MSKTSQMLREEIYLIDRYETFDYVNANSDSNYFSNQIQEKYLILQSINELFLELLTVNQDDEPQRIVSDWRAFNECNVRLMQHKTLCDWIFNVKK